MKPAELLKREIQKLKMMHADVKNEKEDLQDYYQPKLPDFFKSDKFGVGERNLEEFKNHYV